jgi:RHS repeat-associated protein
MSLTREGRFGESAAYGSIDELTYAYNGNQLQSVHDVNDPNHQNNGFTDDGSFITTEYQYDANGNMTQDFNKTLLLTRYNHLNLPQQIIIFEEFGNSILYLYDAAGRKLRKATRRDYNPTHTTDYVGSFVYVDNELQYLLTPEGRVVVDGSNYEYQYFLKDHLGNTRITFNESKQIIQEDSYYPYGMNMAGLSHKTGEDLPNKYRYNGKELQDDFGLDWYDYGARFYDAQIGRWHVVDPAIENNHFEHSPYIYVYNNPILLLDPFGLDSIAAAEVTRAAENAVKTIVDTYDTDGTQSAQCNRGVNEAFTEITESDELKGKTANEIVDQMASSDNFEKVDLDDVQDQTNDGEIIIAGKKETKHGHVALSVPGEEATSKNWGGDVPVGMDTGGGNRWSKKGMNYSFASKTGVTFYKYTGPNNKTYKGGTLKTATISAKGPQRIKSIPVTVIKIN